MGINLFVFVFIIWFFAFSSALHKIRSKISPLPSFCFNSNAFWYVSALSLLKPSKFNYKVDKDDDYLGFIAEDVPDLVATKDRKGLSPMDIVAVLTKVVQQQQEKIEKQQIENAVLNKKLAEVVNRIEALEK